VRSPAARIAIGLATLAAVVILFIVFTGGDDDNDNKGSPTTTQAAQSTTTTQTQTVAATQQITIRGGKPVGGVKKLDYKKGDQVKFIVTSDVADEIHVHGYDVHRDVAKGGMAGFSFRGTIDGIFVVELESRGVQIASLEVTP
jgi:hypothetical protein